MQRRQLLTLLGASSLLPLASLGGCGFQLRRQHEMAFRSIQLSGFSGISPLATELARAAAQVPVTHVEFVALQDTRDSLVSAKTAFGQVRTMTARSILRFEVRRGDGSVLLPASDVSLARDLSYNERDALAKQDESEALTRAMQTDIVNQVMRRLAAIKPQQLPTPPEANKATGGAAR